MKDGRMEGRSRMEGDAGEGWKVWRVAGKTGWWKQGKEGRMEGRDARMEEGSRVEGDAGERWRVWRVTGKTGWW